MRHLDFRPRRRGYLMPRGSRHRKDSRVTFEGWPLVHQDEDGRTVLGKDVAMSLR